jgi:arylformamidase
MLFAGVSGVSSAFKVRMRTYAQCRTAEEFNAGYANRITPEVVAHWEAFFRKRSAEVLASPARRIEFAYGPHARQRIDFFPSPSAGPDAPTLIAIHGGLWFLFDRWMMHFLVPAFTAAGVHVACSSYRLAPQHGLGEIVDDCRRAVTFLQTEAAALGSGRGRFSVLGHSAAGQLAAVLASTDWATVDATQPSNRLHSWIGVSGFYEIEPFALTDFQPFVGFSPEEYRRWNPMDLAGPDLPPGVLITGGRESAWLHEMTEVYQRTLRSAGVAATAIDVPDECHFSVLSRIGDGESPLHRAVLAQLQV